MSAQAKNKSVSRVETGIYTPTHTQHGETIGSRLKIWNRKLNYNIFNWVVLAQLLFQFSLYVSQYGRLCQLTDLTRIISVLFSLIRQFWTYFGSDDLATLKISAACVNEYNNLARQKCIRLSYT
jgi:hypothetical protein